MIKKSQLRQCTLTLWDILHIQMKLPAEKVCLMCGILLHGLVNDYGMIDNRKLYHDAHELHGWLERQQDQIENRIEMRMDTNLSFSEQDYAYMMEAIKLLDHLYAEYKIDVSIGERTSDFDHQLFQAVLRRASQTRGFGIMTAPENIVSLMVEFCHLHRSLPEDATMGDPACGTGSFLVEAAKWVGSDNKSPRPVNGFERNSTMAMLARMNLLFAGMWPGYVRTANPLLEDALIGDYTFDTILVNPGFSQKIDLKTLGSRRYSDTNRSELLYLEWTLDHLRPGGHACIIVPDNVLFARSGSHDRIRERLIDGRHLSGIVSLPTHVFPNTSVQSSVLILEKDGIDNGVWFCNLVGVCGHPTGKWNREFNLQAVVSAYEQRGASDRTAPSFTVRYGEIKDRGYSLLAQEYRERENENTVYESPRVLFEKLRENHWRIGDILDKLGAAIDE